MKIDKGSYHSLSFLSYLEKSNLEKNNYRKYFHLSYMLRDSDLQFWTCTVLPLPKKLSNSFEKQRNIDSTHHVQQTDSSKKGGVSNNTQSVVY